MAKGRTRDWAQPSKGPGKMDTAAQAHSTDSSWETSVRFSESKRQLTIAMPGWSLRDADMEKWCAWFRTYMERTLGTHSDEIPARDVNVAENRLTSAGIRCLLETLSECRVVVLILKLHHNHLEDGVAVADFIIACHGVLRELHLSHNELDTAAAAAIILASAEARDADGEFCYPRPASTGRGSAAVPLWVRLEQNFVDAAALAVRVEPAFKELGRPGHPFCNVSGKACTPHFCAKHRSHPPVIHAKHLSNQRARPPANAESSAQDILNLLLPGRGGGGEATGEAPAGGRKTGHAAHGTGTVARELCSATPDGALNERKDVAGIDASAPQVSDGIAAESTTDASEGAEPASTENEDDTCTVAKVLRWDEDLGQWVGDEIEIEPLSPDSADAFGRFKVSQELGHMMGNELKSMMLGGPCHSESMCVVQPQSETMMPFGAMSFPPPPGFEARHPWHNEMLDHDHMHCDVPEGSLPPHLVSAASAMELPAYPGGASFGDPAAHSMSSWSGAQQGGSQPSSSDTRWANGFAMNPQATEFVPGAALSVKPSTLSLEAPEFVPADVEVADCPASGLRRGSLNPQAAEFTPNSSLSHSSAAAAGMGLPPSMRGISASILGMSRPSCGVELGSAEWHASESAADTTARQEAPCQHSTAVAGSTPGLVLSTVPMQGSALGALAVDRSSETSEVEHACRPYSVTGSEIQHPPASNDEINSSGKRLQEASERTVMDVSADSGSDEAKASVPGERDQDELSTLDGAHPVTLEATSATESAAMPASASLCGATGSGSATRMVEPETHQVVGSLPLSGPAADRERGSAAAVMREEEAESSIGKVFRCALTVVSAAAAFGSAMVVARRRKK